MEQDEIEVNVVKLENDKSYIIVDTIIDEKNNKYLILTNEVDNNDFCVRKVIAENNEEFLVKLESNDEFEEVMTLFYDKHKEKEGE